MTDRLKGCTVAFEKDIREDDAEAILDAIRMVKGVLLVEPTPATGDEWVTEARLRAEIWERLAAVVYPKKE